MRPHHKPYYPSFQMELNRNRQSTSPRLLPCLGTAIPYNSGNRFHRQITLCLNPYAVGSGELNRNSPRIDAGLQNKIEFEVVPVEMPNPVNSRINLAIAELGIIRQLELRWRGSTPVERRK